MLFTTPQPDEAEPLESFPARFTGTFLVDKSDTVVISAKEIKWPEERPMVVNGNGLNDLILKPFSKGLVVNVRDSTGWIVVLMRPMRNRSVVLYLLEAENEKSIERIKALTQVTLENKPGFEQDRLRIVGKPSLLESLYRKGRFRKWVKLKKLQQ